jgi:hypothetical protein
MAVSKGKDYTFSVKNDLLALLGALLDLLAGHDSFILLDAILLSRFPIKSHGAPFVPNLLVLFRNIRTKFIGPLTFSANINCGWAG